MFVISDMSRCLLKSGIRYLFKENTVCYKCFFIKMVSVCIIAEVISILSKPAIFHNYSFTESFARDTLY